MKCRHCDGTVVDEGRLLVHMNDRLEPGSPHMQKCIDCDWKGSDKRYFLNCPLCQSPSLMNDHLAEI